MFCASWPGAAQNARAASPVDTQACVCVCVCVCISRLGRKLLNASRFRVQVLSSLQCTYTYICAYFFFFSQAAKGIGAREWAEPESFIVSICSCLSELPPGTFFSFFLFFFKTCMFFAFAFLGIARGILTELLFFVHLYSSS